MASSVCDDKLKLSNGAGGLLLAKPDTLGGSHVLSSSNGVLGNAVEKLLLSENHAKLDDGRESSRKWPSVVPL